MLSMKFSFHVKFEYWPTFWPTLRNRLYIGKGPPPLHANWCTYKNVMCYFIYDTRHLHVGDKPVNVAYGNDHCLLQNRKEHTN